MNIRYLTDLERRQAEELRILRAAMWEIATNVDNSDDAADDMVAIAQGALRKVQAMG